MLESLQWRGVTGQFGLSHRSGDVYLVPKCVTTWLPRVADRSLCLLPTDVTGRQRSAMYSGASPCSALYVSRQLELDALRDGKLMEAISQIAIHCILYIILYF